MLERRCVKIGCLFLEFAYGRPLHILFQRGKEVWNGWSWNSDCTFTFLARCVNRSIWWLLFYGHSSCRSALPTRVSTVCGPGKHFVHKLFVLRLNLLIKWFRRNVAICANDFFILEAIFCIRIVVKEVLALVWGVIMKVSVWHTIDEQGSARADINEPHL